MSSRADNEIGRNLRRFRLDRGFSLSELAERASVSKGYLSNLETAEAGVRPSAETAYALAKALGVTMSELLGRPNLTVADAKVTKELRAFAKRRGLSQADVAMLAGIKFRGERPSTESRWEFIYNAIRQSEGMDSSNRKR